MTKAGNLTGNGVIEGTLAPDFEIAELRKKLSDFRGKNIVIYFYPRDFTPGCTLEAEEFSLDYPKYQEKKIEIIGVSPDDEKSHNRFKNKMNIPFILTSDTRNEISKSYGVYGLKKFMDKEYFGVERTTFLLDKNGVILKVFHKVKPKGHSRDVLKYFSTI
ncbi:MAG: peroxiredoxin [Nitrososphaeraceae archaeon]